MHELINIEDVFLFVYAPARGCAPLPPTPLSKELTLDMPSFEIVIAVVSSF